MQDTFDPFQDRLSRDIRNDLSASLTRVLAEGNMEAARHVADRYLQQELAPFYRDYIRNRLSEYTQCLDFVRSESPDNFHLALFLWDRRLFFEVHELLEQEWLKEEGKKKLVLQAMIRAAGVYIKLDCGYVEAAQKIAGRAIPVLEKHKNLLAGYFDPSLLLDSLKDLRKPPPNLLDLHFGRH